MNDLIEDKNTNKGMTTSSFSDFKFDKQRELNSGMSIENGAQNAYQRKIFGLGGNE